MSRQQQPATSADNLGYARHTSYMGAKRVYRLCAQLDILALTLAGLNALLGDWLFGAHLHTWHTTTSARSVQEGCGGAAGSAALRLAAVRASNATHSGGYGGGFAASMRRRALGHNQGHEPRPAALAYLDIERKLVPTRGHLVASQEQLRQQQQYDRPVRRGGAARESMAESAQSHSDHV